MNKEPLETGCYYHIYNRGINSCTIFNNDENKSFFIRQLNKYMGDVTSLFAYCLMKNHFHIVLRVDENSKVVTQKLSNFLNSYAKAYNKQNSRTGSLFEKNFRRIKLENTEYLKTVIIYVHLNPSKHLNIDFTEFKHSSYVSYLTDKLDTLSKGEVIGLFNGLDNFIEEYENRRSVLIEKFKLE